MSNDLTFFTNEEGAKLLDRFKKTLENNTQYFDVLVGYFRTSGFFNLYKSLEKVEKIRILVGINVNRQAYDLLSQSHTLEKPFTYSDVEYKVKYGEEVASEIEDSEDNSEVEIGVRKFVEFIKSGKLKIKAYPSQSIHAKVYIIRKDPKNSEDFGKVITGSSNFSYSGLVENLEFNVELKNSQDVKYALEKFEELWKKAVDISETYIDTITTKTWLCDTITPYELYLKFLYEYFKDDLNPNDPLVHQYRPEGFKKLEYQEQAVFNAKKILEEYGGVFISDVVGLGKTYIAAMLAGQLDGRTLVIAPPALLDKNNPGSWPNAFEDFKLSASFESIGLLDRLVKNGTDKYTNVIIDEAHRFRTEKTETYTDLAQICRGKRVILVTATPYNNSQKDILSQIKLFQTFRASTIPNLPNLEMFFSDLDKKLENLDHQKNYSDYIKIVKDNAREIREKVLKYLMVRRTRAEIVKYFKTDLEKQKLCFPTIKDPVPFFYELNDKEDKVFQETIKLITANFHYARYKPLHYYKNRTQLKQPQLLSQDNMGKFMKILMVKRLESSIYAFKKTLERFIRSYEQFLSEYKKGFVYISKKYSNRIFELLENDDDVAVEELITSGDADKYAANDFEKDIETDLESDLATLIKIKKLWEQLERDPKLLTFLKELANHPVLSKNKLIIFTESKETAEYLANNLEEKYPSSTLCFTGSSAEIIREMVIDNFDAKAKHRKDDYRILLATEVLSEGVNLHRSNVVINYDIPWNPTRMRQRVGRVNRVDTTFKEIYTFNFFPSKQANEQIKLKEAAEAKIAAFVAMLGVDAHLLTEGEPIEQHELFNRLTSKSAITGEDEGQESELEYLDVIRNIRDHDQETFDRIKRLPKKARTARSSGQPEKAVITYFRRGKIQKFFRTPKDQEAEELDFITAAKTLRCNKDTPRGEIESNVFYDLLAKNKNAFDLATGREDQDLKTKRGRNNENAILKIINAAMNDNKRLTEEQEDFLKKVKIHLREGRLTSQVISKTKKALDEELKIHPKPESLRIVAVLQTNIPRKLLEGHYVERNTLIFSKREIILSEYFSGK